MEPWRSKAIEIFPELEAEIREAEEPMQLWIELNLKFQEAYREPRDERLIERIYRYASWCLEHRERDPRAGQDLPTCVVVAFYEHLPTHPASLQDIPRWFTREEVVAMRQTFTGLYTGEFERLLALFNPPPPSPSKKSETKRYRDYWRRSRSEP